MDSLQLMSASLEELVKDLAAGGHDFPILAQSGLYTNEEDRQLLLRKQLYPYEWSTSLEKIENATSLPPREDFFSKLKNETISESDYEHACLVYERFNCENVKQYSELYCTLDTYLLAECVEAFRTSLFKEFKIDCSFFVSLPSVAFNIMLSMLDEPIPLCCDADMIMMFEQSVRGGVSFVGRYLKRV